MVLSNHREQKSKVIVNNSTKLVILLSYTDVKDRLILRSNHQIYSKNKKNKTNEAVRKAIRRIYFNDCF